jgi:phospholipase/carboxylesterase
VLLFGALPFDTGVPVTPGRLAGVPVFLALGEHDTVIPPELQRRTWEYLVKQSGSPLWAEREPTGHELTPKTATEVGDWLTERFAFVRHRGAAPGGLGDEPVHWPTLPGGELPPRAGEPPEVSVTTPQQQESQNAPAALQEALHAHLAALDGVVTAPSAISVPGARAFTLTAADARGPDDAFIVPAVREFAHLHPSYDGSLHLTLPVPLAYDVLAKGWGVAHPLAGIRLTPGMIMLFGPRDEAELDVVAGVMTASHAFAHGAGGG